jgi:hypothetical protein
MRRRCHYESGEEALNIDADRQRHCNYRNVTSKKPAKWSHCGRCYLDRAGRPVAIASVSRPLRLRPCFWRFSSRESFFSSLKTERISNKTYKTRNEAKADVFDYIERFYNSKRRHSTIGYLSPMEFERQAGFA